MTGVLIYSDPNYHIRYPYSTSRCMIRTATGIPYVFFVYTEYRPNYKALTAWKGNNSVPTSFARQDSLNEPSLADFGTLSAVIDSTGIVHLVGSDNPVPRVIKYTTFDTNTDSWGAIETVISASLGDNLSCFFNVDIDSNNIPHVAYEYDNADSTYVIHYTNRIGGTWKSPISVASSHSSCPCIIIDADNKPFIVYTDFDGTGYLYAAIGDANNASSFTAQELPDEITTSNISLAVDENGNHYVAYDSGDWSGNNYCRFVMHIKNDPWSTWTIYDSGALTGSDGLSVYITIDKSDIHLFYDYNNGGLYYSKYISYKSAVWSSPVVAVSTQATVASVKWATWIDRDSTGADKGLAGGRKEIDFVYVDYSNDWYFDTLLLPAIRTNVVQMIIEQN